MKFVTIDEMRNPPIEKLYVLIYIACIAAAGFGDWGGLGGIGMYLKVFSLGSFALAILRMLWKSDFKRVKLLGEMFLVFITPLAFVYLLSLGLWSVKTMDTSYISRGTQKILFQCITVVVVISAAYLFGSKAVDYTFYGLVTANSAIMLIQMVRYGIVPAIKTTIESFLTFSNATGYLRTIEIHDITFCMGVFMLYYIVNKNDIKWRWAHIAVSGFFFIIGFKRIAILAIAVAVFVEWALSRLKPRAVYCIILIAQIALIIMSFAYIYIISTGLWTQLMIAMNVDMLGRDRIYAFINDYYSLDITFTGYGFEYTVALLRGMRDSGSQVIHVTGIHCDVLKQYIELGFWGYLIWMLYTYVFQAAWYFRRFGPNAMILFFASGIYVWVTYMTDNTIYYFWLSMTLRVIMISFAFGQIDKRNAGRKPNPRNFKLEDLA